MELDALLKKAVGAEGDTGDDDVWVIECDEEDDDIYIVAECMSVCL